jgi:hypothetical protein
MLFEAHMCPIVPKLYPDMHRYEARKGDPDFISNNSTIKTRQFSKINKKSTNYYAPIISYDRFFAE